MIAANVAARGGIKRSKPPRFASSPAPRRCVIEVFWDPLRLFEMEGKSSPNSQNADATLADCQRLWNEFDPIGLYVGWNDKWSREAYDRYALHCKRLLDAQSGYPVIHSYVRSVVETSMGLKGFPTDEMDAFAKRLERLSHRSV